MKKPRRHGPKRMQINHCVILLRRGHHGWQAKITPRYDADRQHIFAQGFRGTDFQGSLQEIRKTISDIAFGIQYPYYPHTRVRASL